MTTTLTTHTSLTGGKPHVKVYLTDGATSYEHCEDAGCTVDSDGHASCGRVACPACGLGGSNLTVRLGLARCSCGYVSLAATSSGQPSRRPVFEPPRTARP